MFANRTVLIAETFDGQHRSLAKCLEERGAKVRLCDRSKISIEIGAVKYSPSIIVADCCMCGWEETLAFAKKLREADIEPIFYNIYTYEDNETIRVLLDDASFVNISAPYSAEAVCEDMIARLNAIPINVVKFKEQAHKSVSELLISLGITPRSVGYDYIRYMVGVLLFTDRNRILRTYQLYDMAARRYNMPLDKFNKTRQSIERSVRISIGSGWKRATPADKQRYFPDNATIDKKPSNTEFITGIADIVLEQFADAFDKYYSTRDTDK